MVILTKNRLYFFYKNPDIHCSHRLLFRQSELLIFLANMLIAQLEVTAYKAQTTVARERQRSAETLLITFFGETISQHTKKLAIMEERADTDAAVASQETVKLSVGLPLAAFPILTANDVEIFTTFFTQ